MVYIILGEGFEEIEAITPCDILRRGGVSVGFASVGAQKSVKGSHGIAVFADFLVSEISPTSEDTFVIPGGMGGVNSIKSDMLTMKLIETAAKSGASLAAICAGPSVLAQLGIINGKHITCYPGTEELMGGAICNASIPTLLDGKLITGRAPGSAVDFGLELLSHLKGEAVANRIRTELVY